MPRSAMFSGLWVTYIGFSRLGILRSVGWVYCAERIRYIGTEGGEGEGSLGASPRERAFGGEGLGDIPKKEVSAFMHCMRRVVWLS